MQRILIPVLLVLIAAAVFAPTLKFDFVTDDSRQIDLMESRFTWGQIPSYFTSDVWSYVQQQKSNYYRPVFVLWMMLTYQIAGLSHPVWHASAILMHCLATLLFYFVARKLTNSTAAGGIAALLFAVYPVHVEEVAWVSGATEPLYSFLFLAALFCFLRGRDVEDAKTARGWRIGAAVAFAAAMFAKETSAVFPFLIFIYAWLFPRPDMKRMKGALTAAMPFLQILIVYFGMRVVALGTIARRADIWSLKSQIASFPEAAWYYFHALLVPVKLASYPAVYAVHHLEWANFFLPSIALCLCVFALVWAALRSRLAMFAVLLMLIPLLPALYIRAFTPQDFVHGRYLYLPSAGFCLLLAMGFERITGSWSVAARAAIVAPVVLLLGYLTIRESQPWKDWVTLAEYTLTISPDSPPAHESMAEALMLQERFSDAIPWLEKSISEHPDSPALHMGLGMCYFRSGNWVSAAQQMRLALDDFPKSPQARLVLGMAETEQGQLDLAESDLRKAVELRPRASSQFRGYRNYLADLLERKGDVQGAIDEYNRELEEYPDEAAAMDRVVALKKKR